MAIFDVVISFFSFLGKALLGTESQGLRPCWGTHLLDLSPEKPKKPKNAAEFIVKHNDLSIIGAETTAKAMI